MAARRTTETGSDPVAEFNQAATQAFDQVVKQCLTNFVNTLQQEVSSMSEASQATSSKQYRVYRSMQTQTLFASRAQRTEAGAKLVFPPAKDPALTLQQCLSYIQQNGQAELPKTRLTPLVGDELAQELRDLRQALRSPSSSKPSSKPARK